MPNYRRLLVPGGCYFFTVNLLDRNSSLLTSQIDSLRAAVRATRNRFPFEIDAMVVLPDHIHAVWTLPDGDTDFSVRWRWIKIRFARAIAANEHIDPIRAARGERGIWQRRFWEHLIRDEHDYHNHIEYCWFNPVKHGLVERVEDWPYSSFHREHCQSPKPGDFERKLLAHAEATASNKFGERDE